MYRNLRLDSAAEMGMASSRPGETNTWYGSKGSREAQAGLWA
jgi:hypothetical protein